MSQTLIDLVYKLYNWRFTSALEYASNTTDDARQVISHLADRFGDPGHGFREDYEHEEDLDDLFFCMNRLIVLDERLVKIFDRCTVESAAMEVAQALVEHPEWRGRLTEMEQAALGRLDADRGAPAP